MANEVVAQQHPNFLREKNDTKNPQSPVPKKQAAVGTPPSVAEASFLESVGDDTQSSADPSSSTDIEKKRPLMGLIQKKISDRNQKRKEKKDAAEHSDEGEESHTGDLEEPNETPIGHAHQTSHLDSTLQSSGLPGEQIETPPRQKNSRRNPASKKPAAQRTLGFNSPAPKTTDAVAPNADGLEEVRPEPILRNELSRQDIAVIRENSDGEYKIMFSLEEDPEDEVAPTIKFHNDHTSKDILNVLRLVFFTATISPGIQQATIIHIPLAFGERSGTLRLTLDHKHNVLDTQFHHAHMGLGKKSEYWYFGRHINKALSLINENLQVEIGYSPTKDSLISPAVTPTFDGDRSPPPELEFSNAEQLNNTWSKNNQLRTPLRTPCKPKQTEPAAFSHRNIITLPRYLFSASLKNLNEQQLKTTLDKIHQDYKLLKIKRLNNLGRGNVYQSLADPEALRVSSKRFLTDLHIYLEETKPYFFRLAKLANTKNYQVYKTASDYLELKRAEWIEKKKNQDKPVKKLKLEVDVEDAIRLPDSNIRDSFSIEDYKANLISFKQTVQASSDGENKTKEITAINNLAHTYAISSRTH